MSGHEPPDRRESAPIGPVEPVTVEHVAQPLGRMGRYLLLEQIGAGGMGTVYKAEDPQLRRLVALKMPRFDGPRPNRDQAVQRFLREGRAAASIRHPGVCPIHDVGEQDGSPYVVMAYVEGQSLAEKLRGGGRFDDVRQAVDFARQVAEALAVVHGHGIVHRDLKPGNILLDATGRALLTDFGLARSQEDAEHLTVEGAVMGTPAYMAPEQAAGEMSRLGPWTDLYSLGVVLYQMLTGRLPFEGPAEVVISIVRTEEPPPPSHFRDDLDVGLEAIVLKALARKPEDRYPGAGAFADALRRWLSGLPSTTNNPKVAATARPVAFGAARRRVLAILTGAALVVALSIVLASRFGTFTPSAQPPSSGGDEPGTRVEIVCKRMIAGKTARAELPFVVGVLADLSGQPKQPLRPLRDRRPSYIDRDSFNDRLARSGARLALRVENRITDPKGKLAVELNFKHMDDFEPHRVAEQVPELRQLLAQRRSLAARSDRDSLAKVADLDRLLSGQLNEVLHHPEFQRLEATWRGLHYLVSRSSTGPNLRIRVLNVSKQELLEDLNREGGVDQSATFKQIVANELGTPGGEPFGVLIGDYSFSNQPDDVGLLGKLAQVAEAGFCPFIAAAAPQLFRFERWDEFPAPLSLEKIFEAPEYSKWKSFRASESSRYVALTLPYVLARLPYGEHFQRATREFNFEERVDGLDHSRFLWMSACWVYGARLTDAFARHGWLAATCGVSEGRVEGLPVLAFPTEDGEVAVRCPTEIALANRDAELDRLGFMPLLHYHLGGFTVFRRARSCYQPRSVVPPVELAREEAATRLDALLCAARFAHGIQVVIRDRIDVRPDAREYERVLNEWIAGYVLANPEIESTAAKARRPLAEARVEVRQVLDRPGSCRIQVWLRPRYQFDGNPPPLMRLAMTIRSRN